jgi:AcrR family transcriptional regulator
MPRPDRTADAEPTAQKLLKAAMAEFNERGFSGTDTNRIARRAGFAPQTFYRWYADKTAAFIAAYRLWEDEERAMLRSLIAERAPVDAVVDAAIGHHRRYLLFRRSLRQLSLENPTVRQARAESRLRQVERLKASARRPDADLADLAARLFQLERLSDAIAEGELADMGLDEGPARAAMAAILTSLRPDPRGG